MARDRRERTNVLAGASMLASGAGGGIICLPGDDSILCTIKRIVGTIQGAVFIVLSIALLVYVIMNRKKLF